MILEGARAIKNEAEKLKKVLRAIYALLRRLYPCGRISAQGAIEKFQFFHRIHLNDK